MMRHAGTALKQLDAISLAEVMHPNEMKLSADEVVGGMQKTDMSVWQVHLIHVLQHQAVARGVLHPSSIYGMCRQVPNCHTNCNYIKVLFTIFVIHHKLPNRIVEELVGFIVKQVIKIL